MTANNKNTSNSDMERRDGFQTIVKKSVDNSKKMIYNDYKENFGNYPAENWKENHKEILRYAGDGARKSIDKGLSEAKGFMKDATDATNREKVYDTAVKWRLAVDSHNGELYKSAQNEMIGHLSNENKEPYLRSARPMSEFIDAKDEFDYKIGNYTTTENADTVPNENVRRVQSNLNSMGYTDKFGEKLKEDGIMAGKTRYAYDTFVNDNFKNSEKTDGEKFNFDEYFKMTPGGEVASAGGPMWDFSEGVGLSDSYGGGYASASDTKPKLSDGGVLDEHNHNDSRRSENKKTLIKCMSSLWFKNKGNDARQLIINERTKKLRLVDDNNFNKAVFLNNQSGANGWGHNAVMLIDANGRGVVFSFFPTVASAQTLIGIDAEMRFAALEPEEVKNVLNGNGKIINMVATDGAVTYECYDRTSEYTIESDAGKNMFGYAIELYNDPEKYNIAFRNCDHIAVKIFEKGGINIDKKIKPNNTYNQTT